MTTWYPEVTVKQPVKNLQIHYPELLPQIHEEYGYRLAWIFLRPLSDAPVTIFSPNEGDSKSNDLPCRGLTIWCDKAFVKPRYPKTVYELVKTYLRSHAGIKINRKRSYLFFPYALDVKSKINDTFINSETILSSTFKVSLSKEELANTMESFVDATNNATFKNDVKTNPDKYVENVKKIFSP